MKIKEINGQTNANLKTIPSATSAVIAPTTGVLLDPVVLVLNTLFVESVSPCTSSGLAKTAGSLDAELTYDTLISLSTDIFLVDVILSEGEPTSNSAFKLSTDSLHSKKDVDVVDA